MKKSILAFLILILILILSFNFAFADGNRWTNKPPVGSQINWGHPLAKGLIFCWLFQEVGSISSYDLVNKTKNIFNGGVAWSPISSKLNGTFPKFDGTNDSGQATVNLSKWNKITLDFWMSWNTFSNNDKLAFEHSANYNTSKGFIVDPNGSTGGGGGKFEVGCSNGNPTNATNAWYFTRPSASILHHYVIGFDTTQGTGQVISYVYVDGISQNLTQFVSNSQDGNFSNTTLNFMSRNNASLFGAGKLGKISIYNRSLSPSEISKLYENPYCFIKPPTVWSMFSTAVTAARRMFLAQ